MITIPTNGDVTDVMDDTSMATNLTSETMDFEHACTGSIQIIWSGQDANDGTMELQASNETGAATFCSVPKGTYTMDSTHQAHMWILTEDMFAFRYARVVFTKNSVTTGTMRINCTAKGKQRG